MRMWKFGAAGVCAGLGLATTVMAQPAATDLGTLTNGTPVQVSNIAIAPQGIVWYRFTVPAVTNLVYLDIDTEGSFLSTSNDTEIGVYDSAGNRIADDDDGGSGLLSQLSFGAGFPARPAVGTGAPYDGRHGPLAAGTYYIAVGGFNTTFNNTGWSVGSTSNYTGNAVLNFAMGTVPPPPPGTFLENGDAGETVATAQLVTGGNGAVTAIRGAIANSSDADLYRINICDTTVFTATTDGGTSLDTQMFLFTATGMGVAFNDDISASGTINRQSRITNMFVAAPGEYLVAVVAYNRDAQDANSQFMWLNTPFDGERAPDGPGAANPLDHWSGTTSTGTYMITLSGVCYPGGGCPVDMDNNGQIEPSDVAAFISVWFTSLQQGTLAGDFDHNNTVEPADVAAFVGAWFNALTSGSC